MDLFQNYTTLSAIIPRQIKPDDESIIFKARAFNFILACLLFGGIGISYLADKPIDKFLYILTELQLVVHLPLLNHYVPGNVLIVFA